MQGEPIDIFAELKKALLLLVPLNPHIGHAVIEMDDHAGLLVKVIADKDAARRSHDLIVRATGFTLEVRQYLGASVAPFDIIFSRSTHFQGVGEMSEDLARRILHLARRTIRAHHEHLRALLERDDDAPEPEEFPEFLN